MKFCKLFDENSDNTPNLCVCARDRVLGLEQAL